MSKDLINPSITFTTKRNKIPRFSRVKGVLDSKNLLHDLVQLGSGLLTGKDYNNLNVKDYFDKELENNLLQVLKKIPEKSFVYNYLALNLDFIQIRQIYLENFNTNQKTLENAFLKIKKKLLCLELYREALKEINKKVNSFTNSFEWIMELDQLYLDLLQKIVEKSTTFNKNFVAKKIDTYNVSAFYRLQLLGKDPHSLKAYLIKNSHGLNAQSLNKTFIEELVSKIMNTVNVVTAEQVEIAMKIRELQFLKTAIFEGFGEPLILLYIEMLKTFFYDLKLIAIYQQLGSDKEDIKNHLINYDLT